jgi:hypothetical protein
MPRKEPVVAFEVFDSVLAFAIAGLVEFLDNLCAGGFGSPEVGIHIVNKHR